MYSSKAFRVKPGSLSNLQTAVPGLYRLGPEKGRLRRCREW